ncbi:hypothetical protein DY000_02015136 [Brassica cretica]|uniref:Uncharacterized protein n=1 Tax=Brassica cretica TaxID=69181 RepID=A0ABQ7D8N7_BRACR|nr:hypothetical protein DY000_02015136 [Brassica cretica]
MEEAASENNVSDATPEGDNTVDDQQESRAEHRLSETIPGMNICPEPCAAQPVPKPEAANCSIDRSFARDCSARRVKGSSDDDASGKQKEGEKPRSEPPPLSDEELEQSAETDPTPVAQPVDPVPPREYTPKVPYPVPAKTSRKDREETKCKKMLEDLTIKLPLVDAIQMIPA